jgi:hypothetical protein
MKRIAKLLLGAAAIASVALSGSAFARHLTVVNTANYKMSIVAFFQGGGYKNWYCPAHHHCRLNQFPFHVRTIEIKKYDNPHKYTYYPNKHNHVNHPFNNKKIRCENRRYHIACFNVRPG